MGDISLILSKYSSSRPVLELKSALENNHVPRVIAQGITGSQICFVVGHLSRNSQGLHLFIATDKEEAAYLVNSLEHLMDPDPVYFFPDSYKRPMQFEEVDNTNVLQRTETVNNLLQINNNILITYPEALFEKVVDPENLERQRIDMVCGESFDVDTAIAFLTEYGFERVDFVLEPGQYSIRGGIVDIFTFGNEWPYRIELFDDEVESIRNFHPGTQLSIRNLNKVSIIPNINVKFNKEDKVSLLKVLPQNTTVWIKNFELLLEKLQTCFEKSNELKRSMSFSDNPTARNLLEEEAYIFPRDVLEDLSHFSLIFLETGYHTIIPDAQIKFNSSPQPSFNKNFTLLIQDFHSNTLKDYENYLFTDNARQILRFKSIFHDLKANVNFHPILKSIHEGFIDHDIGLALYTDHQIFNRFHQYKLKRGFTKEQALNLKMLRELEPGDFVVHIDHGVGRYSGLEKININGYHQESVRLIYQNNDVLYVGINSLHKISRYSGKEGHLPKLNKLGSDTWQNTKRKTRKQIKDIASGLIKLYAQRKASEGFSFPPDGYLQNELEASFIYEDTPDQELATIVVKEDMMKPHPMDRLICGDVGFGKTEVAIRAAFKAVVAGKQVVVLVPTTILALQHYKTFTDRLQEFGLRIDYINRFKSVKEKNEIFRKLKDGTMDIIIGTHAILSKEAGFKDLGLLIIDEEQKFGVAAKEKLRNLKVNVDTLTLTATPIPRTLQFSLMAARDLSILRTPPPNRQPIHTERRILSDELIRNAIYYEVNRGGQVFFVHNRVKTLLDIQAMIQRLCPDLDIAIAHGQMDSKKLEKTLIDFIEGKYDVLVCTNIIETGLDIPNANTIIINNAQHYGLSDLHQLRGRVGRSNKKAFCYLFAPPLSVLTSEARKRLQILEENSDLGSGFQIAMKDLDIRGAGNLLGAEQSGFISDIGFETYQKILEEAIQELKENEFRDVFAEENNKKSTYVKEVEIETDIEMLIPDQYVSVIQERLKLYTEMDHIINEEEIQTFHDQLKDRFGPVPKEVQSLFEGLRIRWKARELGFEKVSFKGQKLRCYFIRNPQSPFYESLVFQNILEWVSVKGVKEGIILKQSRNYLIFVKDNIRSLQKVNLLLQRIIEDVVNAPVL